MAKVFISYSRKDTETARKIVTALQANDLDAWVDWEDIPPTADWLDQIHKGIEDADAFLFLLSPDSVKSKVCRQEIEHAAQNNKRLIPLVVREVSPDDVPPALAKLNWIFFREGDNFKAAVKKLDAAIKTDLAWVEAHRRLQVRAIEWDRQQNRSLLLRGDDLRNAEEMLASAGQKDPQPTDLQRRYVLESRRREARTRGMVVTISIIASVILAIAAVIAVIQSNTATSEANSRATAEVNAVNEAHAASTAESIAISAEATTAYSLEITEIELRQARVGQLSAQAELLLDQSPATSLLLSIEAVRLSTAAGEPVTHETSQALRDSLAASAGIPLPGNTGQILALAVSPDGRWLASAGEDGSIHIWDLDSPDFAAEPAVTLSSDFGAITHLAFLPDDRLASAREDGLIHICDLNASDPGAYSPAVAQVPPPIDALAVSPDGRWLAAGGGEQAVVLLWDLSVADPQARPFRLSLRDPEPGFYDLEFSPDSLYLAASKGNGVGLWRLSSGAPIEVGQSAIASLPASNAVGSAASPARTLLFSPDSYWLFAGADTGIFWCSVTTMPACQQMVLRSSGLVYSDYASRAAMAISSDGDWLAAGYTNGTLKLWDISGGFNRDPTLLEGHLGPVTALAFSADNHWLASGGGEAADARGQVGSSDGTTRLWDLASADPNAAPTVLVTGSRFPRLAFAPDGDWLAVSSDDTAVRLLDLRTLSFSPDPIVLGDGISTVETSGPGRSSNFVNSDRWLWYIDSAREAVFLDLSARDPLTTISSRGANTSLIFSPDGQWMASTRCEFRAPGRWLNTEWVYGLYLENVAAETRTDPLTLWPAENTDTHPIDISFSPDSLRLIHTRWTYYADTVILILYDLSTAENTPPAYRFEWPTDNIYNPSVESIHMSPDSHRLVINQAAGGLLLDLTRDDPTADPPGLQGFVVASFSPDSRQAAVFDPQTGDVGLMDLSAANPSGSVVILGPGAIPFDYQAVPPDTTVRQFSFSPDGRWLLLVVCEKTTDDGSACEADGQRAISMWDLARPDPAASRLDLPAPVAPQAAAFSPDSRWLVTLDREGSLNLVALESGEIVRQFQFYSSETSQGQFAIDPQGRWLATLDGMGNAALLDLRAPQEPLVVLGNQGFPIGALAFNRDGTLLAEAAASGRVLLWDMTAFPAESRPLLLTGGTQAFDRVVFTADGRLLIADGPSASIYAWHLDFDAVLDLACQAAGRNLTQTEWSLYGFSEDYRATCPQWPLDRASVATPNPVITPTPTTTPTPTP